MKLNVSLLLTIGSSVGAFAPRAFLRPSLSSRLGMQVDTSEAIQQALEASETFGKTSPEARSAWELVEELDAANSHDKSLQKQIAKKQAEIDALLKQQSATKAVAPPMVHSDTSDAVKRALEASRVHGASSPEARIAWEEVEEMDASNSHHKSDDVHVAKQKAVEVVEETPTAGGDAATTTSAPQTVEEAINAAMFLSKVYGKHATESRLAWELVEELEARDSHKRAMEKAALEKIAKATTENSTTSTSKPQTVANAHADSADAIAAAMKASELFGKTSKEARLAWELVEEIDAANAHHKTVGTG